MEPAAVILSIANSKLDEFDLRKDGWQVTLGSFRGMLGETDFGKKLIRISRPWVEGPDGVSLLTDTVLHEIAHVLAGPGHGHDVTWRTIARSIGARPQARRPITLKQQFAVARYLVRCPECPEPLGSADSARYDVTLRHCSQHPDRPLRLDKNSP